MSADTTSIFYKIGQATKTSISNAIAALKAANNTWTGTNDFKENVTVGGSGEGEAKTLTIYGQASTTADFTVGGNLTVNGTTTTLSTSTMEVDDNIIHLSKGASDGTYNKDSGFYFERGTGLDAQALIWDESEARFTLGALGSQGDTLEVTLNGKKRVDDTVTSTFVATFTLFGQLADDVNSIEITGVSGGPTATDYNGAVSPWTFSGGVLTYTFDSDNSSDGGVTYPQPSFSQFQEDVRKLGYDATNGYYVLATADGTIFDVNFADSNYADYDFTIDYSLASTPVEILVTSPDDDTANVTPGKFLAGEVQIVDAVDGVVELGDLADFNAGLA